MRMYVNGEFVSEKHRTDGQLGNFAGFPLEIGHYVASRSQEYKGLLDELRVYRRALSVDRIAEESQKQATVVGIKARVNRPEWIMSNAWMIPTSTNLVHTETRCDRRWKPGDSQIVAAMFSAPGHRIRVTGRTSLPALRKSAERD